MQFYSIPKMIRKYLDELLLMNRGNVYLNDILLLSNLAGTAAKAFFVGPEIDPLDDVLTGIGEVGWLAVGVLPVKQTYLFNFLLKIL